MKKPKYKDKRKRARDGDRVSAAAAVIAIGLVVIYVLPKTLDTVSKTCKGFAILFTTASAILIIVSLLTEVRATQIARYAWLSAIAACIMWIAPSRIFKNFEEAMEWDFLGVVPIFWSALVISILFWLFIKFLQTKS